MQREVLAYVDDAWVAAEKSVIGYEVSFNRYFSKPIASEALVDLRAEVLKAESESEGLVSDICDAVAQGQAESRM